ncbi:MAG TPA: LUD domain-containing protein [Terriglobales bacterium]|nr:LUD domain-containing protein [Terriglobales bacterium]
MSSAVGTQHDLIARFEAAARSSAATVERVPATPSALASAVARIAKGRTAIAEPLDLPAELFADLYRLPGIVTARSKSELAACDVGITDAFAVVARTGSVCVTIDHAYSGAISLLARMHIAVAAAETIVERPAEIFDPNRFGGKGLTRNFVFITGPSATADMGPLVRGVHGPHKLHVIVLE